MQYTIVVVLKISNRIKVKGYFYDLTIHVLLLIYGK